MKRKIYEQPFNSIYGYEDIKKELLLIRDMFKNKKNVTNKKVMLPKGILFYGPPGCGKTMFLREYAKLFNSPIFIISGKSDNVSSEIKEVFDKARNEKFALVLIDEIDLLMHRNFLAQRILQQEIDGINTNGSIFILATTNSLRSINGPLKRPGRFDRIIPIKYPSCDSRIEMLKNFLKELNVNTNNINFKRISNICLRTNGADIKSICNDAYLRCGDNINTNEMEISFGRIVRDDYSNCEKKYRDFRVAIHEGGHALMALNFKNNWTFYDARFDKTGGITEIYSVNEKEDNIKKREESLIIALSGYIAEEVYFGYHDVGSYSDYQKAYRMCYDLLETNCIKGIENAVLPYHDNDTRYETPKKRRHNEKLVRKMLFNYEKQARKYIKHNRLALEKFASTMYNNGRITCKEANSIVLSHQE